ncbi:hypothetical protein DSO57_1001631 [Entomophthora muscae]|uniref:Uncharacterized protein n=1 Tax=Entomophthora muscae TaxID=34485 RepID=A0ACC2RZU4_9FUNG|nr:hypothetical protein DSO57_1001631 [Entomophthora muscae]
MKATLGSKIPPSQAMATAILAWLRKFSTEDQQICRFKASVHIFVLGSDFSPGNFSPQLLFELRPYLHDSNTIIPSCTTTEEGTMPAYMAQQLWCASLEPFAGANNNNATACIQSAQRKLAQMKCPQNFWITEISIHLIHDTGTWCNK